MILSHQSSNDVVQGLIDRWSRMESKRHPLEVERFFATMYPGQSLSVGMIKNMQKSTGIIADNSTTFAMKIGQQ